MKKEDRREQSPIGIFDSGVGGLTVAKEIMKLLPREDLVYFGDTARVPYGNKSKENILRFSRQIVHFLKTKGVKGIVVACNTASALALPTMEKQYEIPIIGVIEAGARAAALTSESGVIGVIGTEATIQSRTYEHAIQKHLPLAQVMGVPCPLFVPLVEEGLQEHKITREVLEYYLRPLKESAIDTLILGCTHYPLLESVISTYFEDRIHIVNPAYETAKELQEVLKKHQLKREEGIASYEFYVSDAAEKFTRLAESILEREKIETKEIQIEEYER